MYTHHSALRRQKMARATGEGHKDEYDAPRRQKPPPPQAFFQLFDEEDADKKMRPASLAERRGPQERVHLRTVEHIADVMPRGAGSGYSCATEGGTAGGFLGAPGHADTCRAGLSQCPRSPMTVSSRGWWTVICVVRRWQNS